MCACVCEREREREGEGVSESEREGEIEYVKSKLMRIELSNREWPFLRLLAMAQLPRFD